MDIHVDQKDRSTLFFGQPMMPDNLLSQTQIQAVDFLEGCVRGLEPLAALTGGAGTGKTFVLNAVLERAGGRVIRVNNFVAGPLSLHRVLASAVGVPDAGDLSAEALEPVLRRALAEAGQSEPPLLAVDDAQSLLPETLHYLCLLAGLREGGRPLLRILLVGRPGFTVRQSMPLQFTLNAASLDDVRRMVLHGLDAAGISASDDAVQDIVRSSQGNLRKLELLLSASIEQAKASGRRRIASVGVQQAAGARTRPRMRRHGSALSPWLAVPALLVVGVAGVGIAHHDGMFRQPSGRPTSPPPVQAPAALPGAVSSKLAHDTTADITAPAALPSPAPVVTASSEPARVPSIALPPTPVPAVPTSPPPPAPTPSVPGTGSPGTETSAAPAPVPVAPAPPNAGTATAVPSAPVLAVPVPVAQPPAVAGSQPPAADTSSLPPAAPQPAPAAQASAPPNGTRFRVYNISSCHQGICPRWSVTDLDQRSRFVAAFNPSNLHLDRGTIQKLREGSLDLIVSGSMRRGGGGSQILDADSLQSIAPHHGRGRPAATEPIDLAPPPTQSPPPGFLALPSGEDH